MDELTKLTEILQKENEDNYSDVGLGNSATISHKERLLSRLETYVFGNNSIQEKEFKKLCETRPEFKIGLDSYNNS